MFIGKQADSEHEAEKTTLSCRVLFFFCLARFENKYKRKYARPLALRRLSISLWSFVSFISQAAHIMMESHCVMASETRTLRKNWPNDHKRKHIVNRMNEIE